MAFLCLPAGAEDLDAARALQAAGRLEEAVAAYRAVAAARQTDDPAAAGIARNNACVALVDLGDYRAALEECRQALAIRSRLDDPLRLGRSYNNLGLALQHLGRFDEAGEAIAAALTINRRLGDAHAEALNLSNLGVVATLAGRYDDALARLHQAARLIESQGEAPWAADQARTVALNRGVVLERLGAFEIALELYDRLIAAGDALSPRQRALVEVNRGTVLRNLGDPVRAVERFRAAIDAWRALDDRAGLANATLNLALALHRNLARPAEAERAYRQALALARESGDRSEETATLIHLGDLLLEQGRVDGAERLFEQGLDAAAASGSRRGRWSALDGLGRTAAARGDLDAALARLRQALEVIEEVGAGIGEASLRASYLLGRRAVYGTTALTLADLDRARPGEGHAEAAFAVVLRAKRRELIDALGQDERPGTDPAAIPSLGAVRAALGDDQLLELFRAGDRLLRFTVSRTAIRLDDLGPAGPILDAVGDVHRALAAGEAPPPERLRELSERLLANTLEAVSEDRRDAGRRLWVAPDGRLHYLPFELLRPPARDATVLDLATVAYLPSGALLVRPDTGAPGPAPARRLLGFGDPLLATMPGEGAGLGTGALLAGRFDLRPLPAAGEELAAGAAHLGGDHTVYLGVAATEAALRAEAGTGARVLHLATHALVDERLGRGAAVVLAPAVAGPPADGEPGGFGDGSATDGLLFADEIAALEVRASLTVLAACSTALGGEQDDGRGLSSLTGAFLTAGSGAVIATLWDVGDRATAVFMDQLYLQLGRGLAPAEALRRAKLRLRDDPRWQRPDLWAGYVLIGDAPPVAGQRRRFALLLAAAGLVLAAFAAVLLLRGGRARGA